MSNQIAATKPRNKKTRIQKRSVSLDLEQIVNSLHELVYDNELEKIFRSVDNCNVKINELIENQASSLLCQKELLQNSTIICNNTNMLLDLESLKLTHEALDFNKEILVSKDNQTSYQKALLNLVDNIREIHDLLKVYSNNKKP